MLRILSVLRSPLKAIDERIGIETFKLGIVLATVYFAQGMGGLSNIPLLFYFKDVLHFNEAQMQYFAAITGIAWLVKPVFGFISDRFPIFGYRRKTYMVMMATLAALSWWGLAWMSANGVNHYFALVLIFNLSSLGYAFVDVVCDAIMVERGQAEKMETAFVNLQWFSLGIAGVIAASLGGELQTLVASGTLPLAYVFIATGCIPFMTALVAIIFVREKRIDRNDVETGTDARIGWKEIKEVFSIRTFWLLTAFIFFWKYSPSFGAVFSYYNIDILRFDPKFLGALGAIDKAIFPLSIILYAGLRKFFPQIKMRHYLYASIVISLIYYAVHLLFLIPESTFNWIGNDSQIRTGSDVALLALAVLGVVIVGRHCLTEQGAFVLTWSLAIPLSFFAALWFAGIDRPAAITYRSLAVANTVLFGYATIASFLIPLTLAAELAPKKAEGMTYAYFMALINISGGFLPDISGAWMFEVLKTTLQYPETAITFTTLHWQNTGAYLTQQSFALLKPVIGQADFLSGEAYRALILRYALIIGAIFTLISTPFVYLLPKAPDEDK